MTISPLARSHVHSPSSVLDRLLPLRLDLLSLVRYDERQRWHMRLDTDQVGTDRVEVWLLSWLPSQASPLHDHGGSSGAFTVLFGALDETVVDPVSGRATEHLWTRGPVRAFGENHVHEVRNDGDVPTVSLHAYEPALSAMTRYRRLDGRVVPRTIEVAGVDW
jgi:predicted metal-dependent enzyme (double-stranded beta helix superfamily)